MIGPDPSVVATARRRSSAPEGRASSTLARIQSAAGGTRCRQRRRQVDVGVTAECVPGEVSEHRPPAGEIGDAQRGVGVRDAVLLGQQAGDLVRREGKVGGVPLAHLPRQARTGRGVER